jgi:hypothetical protein
MRASITDITGALLVETKYSARLHVEGGEVSEQVEVVSETRGDASAARLAPACSCVAGEEEIFPIMQSSA